MNSVRRRLAAVLLAQRLSSGRGLMLVVSGVLTMIVSVWHHDDLRHAGAAIVFVALVFAMRRLARLDDLPRSPLTRNALRIVDWASVVLLVAVPYVPFTFFAYHADEFWGVAALVGSTLLLWYVLGALIAFRRSLFLVMVRLIAVWAVAMRLRFALDELEVAAAVVLLAAAGLISVLIVARAIRAVPRQWATGWSFVEDAEARS